MIMRVSVVLVLILLSHTAEAQRYETFRVPELQCVRCGDPIENARNYGAVLFNKRIGKHRGHPSHQ